MFVWDYFVSSDQVRADRKISLWSNGEIVVVVVILKDWK